MLRTSLIASALALALAVSLPAAASTQSTNPAARKLIDQALADVKQRKFGSALVGLDQAVKIDNTTSEARRLLAALFLDMALADDSHTAQDYRRAARRLATEALTIDPTDDRAQEVLTGLTGAFDQQYHQPAPAVDALSEEAGLLYDKAQYVAASRKYEQALNADPDFPDTYVYLGNTLVQMNELKGAEQAYQKAIELDRNFEGAWIALYKLTKITRRATQGEAAALGAITALPSTFDGWSAMNEVFGNKGVKLRSFDYRPKGSYSVKGKAIKVDQDLTGPDQAAWNAVANAQKTASDPALQRSAFAVVLATWDAALREIAEIDKKAPVTDPTLRDMLAFRQAGQLKAALFTLQYREIWRADFEAWKKAEPDGVKRFINTFRVSP